MTVTGHEGIKEIEGKNGKKRYQAQVWYDRKFITSKTFDSLALAQIFKCPRRSKSEPPGRLNIEPGVEADFERVGCG